MPRLLLIDDDRFILRAVEKLLTAEGYYCQAAGSAEEARRALAGEPFDLVVLDIGLPDQDGFALCRQIRARHRMPILFLTAREENADKVIGLEIGGDDYLTKPFRASGNWLREFARIFGASANIAGRRKPTTRSCWAIWLWTSDRHDALRSGAVRFT